MSALDTWFLKQAQHTNGFEVAGGNAAMQKTTNPAVQAYASMLVQDHTAMADQVAAVAASHGVAVENAPSPVQRFVLGTLSAVPANAFDASFLSANVAGHIESIELFEKEANAGSSPDVQALASAALPVLQKHLDEAQALLASMSPAPSGATMGS